MSRTPSVGVVGPSYWGYAAGVTAEYLEGILDTGRRQPALLPKGVHESIKRFFRLVIESTAGHSPRILSASLANYRIAAETVAKVVQNPPKTFVELDALLLKYSQAVETLGNDGVLSDEERLTADDLRRFFAQIASDGDEESYDNFVSGKHVFGI